MNEREFFIDKTLGTPQFLVVQREIGSVVGTILARCFREDDAQRIRDWYAAAHARGELDSPQPKPDWEALLRRLVTEIYASGHAWNASVNDLQHSPAATAARDAVRAQKPEPDERVGPKDRRNNDGLRAYDSVIISPDGSDPEINTTYGAKRAGGRRKNSPLTDRRNHTGTRADRREGDS